MVKVQVPQSAAAPQYAAQQYMLPQHDASAQYAPQYAASQYTAAQQQFSHAQQLQQRQTSIALPADAYPGREYSFQAPDGRAVSFSVPAGTGPGSVISVSY